MDSNDGRHFLGGMCGGVGGAIAGIAAATARYALSSSFADSKAVRERPGG